MPTRHSSIGRDIIRGIDIDQDCKRSLDTDIIADSSESKITETIPSSEGALVDIQTRKRHTELNSVAEPEGGDRTELTTTRDIFIDLDEAEIDSFVTHRVDEVNATVDLLVKWADGEQSWKPEWSLQHKVPVLIYKYWDTVGGRDAATGLNVYHVFRVLERSPPHRVMRDLSYRVQWVGFSRSECTWEHQRKLAQIAPDELTRFMDKGESALKAPARKHKRRIARRSGRPRKAR
jgi:hypothetical protein